MGKRHLSETTTALQTSPPKRTKTSKSGEWSNAIVISDDEEEDSIIQDLPMGIQVISSPTVVPPFTPMKEVNPFLSMPSVSPIVRDDSLLANVGDDLLYFDPSMTTASTLTKMLNNLDSRFLIDSMIATQTNVGDGSSNSSSSGGGGSDEEYSPGIETSVDNTDNNLNISISDSQLDALPVTSTRNVQRQQQYNEEEEIKDCPIQTPYEIHHDSCILYQMLDHFNPLRIFIIERFIANGQLSVREIDQTFLMQLSECETDEDFYKTLYKRASLTPPYKLIRNKSREERKFRTTDTPYYGQEVTDNQCIVFELHVDGPKYSLQGPTVQITNKLVKRFGEYRLLVVSFSSKMDATEANMKIQRAVVEKKIRLAGRTYQFLASSGNGIRDRRVYFFSVDGLECTIPDIYNYMGDFSQTTTVSKLLTRLSLYFSKATPTVAIEPNKIQWVQDITRKDKTGREYVFTDGCGLIGVELLRQVLERFGVPEHEIDNVSAIQIRFLGVKGVLMKDPTIDPMGAVIPESMDKFKVENPYEEQLQIGVLSYSYNQPAKLNRDMILILQDRGVPFEVFEALLKVELEKLQKIRDDPVKFFKSSPHVLDRIKDDPHLQLKKLQKDSLATQLRNLIFAGFSTEEPYIRWKFNTYLQNLYKVAGLLKFLIPKSAYVIGVPDWLGVLEEDEVFIQIDNERAWEHDVIIGRHPMTNNGDIQRVRAVDRRELRHLKNVVVFSTKGERPLADKLSGGDYDGDKYIVVGDPSFVTPFKNVTPMTFILDDNCTESNTIGVDEDIELTMRKMKNYWLEFPVMQHLLESLSVMKQNIADAYGMGFEDMRKISSLINRALDAQKTGDKFIIPHHIQTMSSSLKQPHYMLEIGEEKPTYQYRESNSFCGRLYNLVKKEFKVADPVKKSECIADSDLYEIIQQGFPDLSQSIRNSIGADIRRYNAAYSSLMESKEPGAGDMIKLLGEEIVNKYMAMGQKKMLQISLHFYHLTYMTNAQSKEPNARASLSTAFLFPKHLMQLKANAVSDRILPGSVGLTFAC